MNIQRTKITKLFSFSNISLFIILFVLLYLTYSVIFSGDQRYVDLPSIDFNKHLNDLNAKQSKILENQQLFDNRLDSLNENLTKSKSNIYNIYKSSEDEKTFIQNANDSVNYMYFIDYINNYKGTD